MRLVFDTNTLISAVISKGKPRKLLLKALAKEFILVSSKELLKELEEVVARPKFKLTSAEASKFVNTVRKTSKIIKVKSNFRAIKEDPDDDKVLNTAYDGNAAYIISGDHHLQKLKTFKGIKIVTVTQILRLL